LEDTGHIDEVFIPIQSQHNYLWRAVDPDGDMIDILVQRRRNQKAAERYFRRLLKSQGSEPRWLLTDKLRSYDAAHRTVIPPIDYINHVYANNRSELLHQPKRKRERAMRGFRSSNPTQRFLTLHGLTQNLFRLGRCLMQVVNYRILRTQAFQMWKKVVCA
jgi:putative transposase